MKAHPCNDTFQRSHCIRLKTSDRKHTGTEGWPALSRCVAVGDCAYTVRPIESAQLRMSSPPPCAAHTVGHTCSCVQVRAYVCITARSLSRKDACAIHTRARTHSPIAVAPASMPFSTSSFTATARDSTTWPEQILWTDPLSIGTIPPLAILPEFTPFVALQLMTSDTAIEPTL